MIENEAGFDVRVWGLAMWGLLAWLVLLAATVVLASVAFHFDVDHLPAAFQALSPTQQVAAILIALVALALAASTLWQSWRLTREAQQARAVQGGILGAKKGAALAATCAKGFRTQAVAHLRPSDPEDALSTITAVGGVQARLSLQRAATKPSTKERLEEVAAAEASREQIGAVAEAPRDRAGVEELKDRQRQLARSLDKIETDDRQQQLHRR